MHLLPADYEIRVTFLETQKTQRITNRERPIIDQIREAGVNFDNTEFGWLTKHGGVENDQWLVRIAKIGEPLIDGVEGHC